MKRIVFVDLDDTLFQTQKKNRAARQLAAVDRQGHPLSFQSEQQVAFYHWLACDDALLIPVTGRNVPAFRRVQVPFSGLAVCSFGGVILHQDGHVDATWDRHISQHCALVADRLKPLCERVKKLALQQEADVRCSVVEDAGKPLYLSIKPNTPNCDVSAFVTPLRALVPAGWTLHVNGHNMALLPAYLAKEHAVSYLIETCFQGEARLLVGVGDSVTDRGFMALCDFAIVPAHSQIMTLLQSYLTEA